MMNSKSAFTLIEVILTVGIASFLIASITMVFLTNYRVFNAVSDRNLIRNQLASALLFMSDELQYNANGLISCNTSSGSSTLTFTVYDSNTLLDLRYDYYLDASNNLRRKLNTDPSGAGKLLASKITSANFLCSSTGKVVITLTASNYSESITQQSTVIVSNISTSQFQNLVAWFKFDETTGTTVYDSSGNGYTGTMAGGPPVWLANGVSGSALTFGANAADKVTMASSYTVAASGAYTITAWYKANSLAPAADTCIVCQSATGRGLMLASGSARPKFISAAGTTTSPLSPVTAVAGIWYHIAITYDDSKNYLVFYLNGDTPKNFYSSVSGRVPFDTIGYGNGKVFKGSLDDVRIYNRALSQAEIQALWCQYGRCCLASEKACNNAGTWACYDLGSSATNCGTCGTSCGAICSQGTCCNAGEMGCNGSCTTVATDPNNCGTCGNVCSGGTPDCGGGVCIP